MLDILSAAAAGNQMSGIGQFMNSGAPMIIGMVAIFWFLIFRPQMKKQKEHAAKIAGVKKNDSVVTAGGVIGKVTRVDDDYVDLEIAQGVRIKVVKTTLGDIVPPGGKPAND